MALAEARAAWQRTANRCWVQEDAKWAPSLACYPSVPPSFVQAEIESTNVPDAQDIPNPWSPPYNKDISCYNLSPSSKWWLQMPPMYGYQKGLIGEQFSHLESNCEACTIPGTSVDSGRIVDDCWGINQTSDADSLMSSRCRSFIGCRRNKFPVKEGESKTFSNWSQDHLKLEAKDGSGELSDEGHFSCNSSKESCDIYFDSESSYIASGKSTPWWRTADAGELASLGSKKSLHLIENCDLPRPQHAHFRKGLNSMCYPTHTEINGLDQTSGIRDSHTLCTCDSTPCTLSGSHSHSELRMPVGEQSLSSTDQALRYRTTHKRMAEMHAIEGDTGNAKLLEALRHSQTRAREAEDVAKQACAEKDHIIKLVIRQASQIFAYKQWIQLLQLENMCFQLRDSESKSASTAIPVMIPLRTQKDSGKPRSRKRVKRGVFYVIGLGLIGAGLLLGWTIGWMLPTWWC